MPLVTFQNCLKYNNFEIHSWYLGQISLQIMLLPIQIVWQVVYRLQFLRLYLITFYKWYILYQISAMQIFLPILSVFYFNE